jgi:hypothetical protein
MIDPRLVLALSTALGSLRKLLMPLLLVAVVVYFVYVDQGKEQFEKIKNIPTTLYEKVLGKIKNKVKI